MCSSDESQFSYSFVTGAVASNFILAVTAQSDTFLFPLLRAPFTARLDSLKMDKVVTAAAGHGFIIYLRRSIISFSVLAALKL